MKIFFQMTLLFLMSSSAMAQPGFKKTQQSFPRVRDAYDISWKGLEKELSAAKFKGNFQLYIAAYKSEGLVELWLKNTADKQYRLFKTYSICASSGILGPKVQENDRQVPEGFYYINAFNPSSNFHLSLRLNYPNAVDLARSGNRKPGSDIYIHGSCVTVGCLPLTDPKIKEVYVLAVEAKNGGQPQIPVAVFPFRMNKSNLDKYLKYYPQQKAFWTNIQPGYLHFEQTKTLPTVTQKEGKYLFR